MASAAALAALFLIGLLAPRFVVAGGAPAARAAPARAAADVTLKLWPAGQGRIEATQGGRDLIDPLNLCGFTQVVEHGAAAACEVTVAVGTAVTLTAVTDPKATVAEKDKNAVPDFPVAQPAFVRWSLYDCGSAPSCTFTPTADMDGDFITALFTPLQLQLGISGQPDDVTFRRSDGVVVKPKCEVAVGLGDRTCHAAVPADLDVVIEVSPNPRRWGAGCEPDGGSLTSPRCTLGMSNLRTLATASFNDQDPPNFPFHLTPTVKVKLGGSGQGRVSGTGIDCPSTCHVGVDYQTRVRLRAEESAGSTFVRWVGVCATDRNCTFNAGSATEVQARFDTTAATTTTTRTATTATTTTATTATTTTTTIPRPKKPQLRGVAVRGHGAGREVVYVLIVEHRGSAKTRLLRRGKALASRTYQLAQGRNALRLHLPRRVRAGRYQLAVQVRAGGAPQTVVAPVRIPR